MAKRIKVRIDTGCVGEPYVYRVPGGLTQKARPRWRTEAGWLRTAAFFWWDQEPHTEAQARRIRDNYLRRLRRACPEAVIHTGLRRLDNGRFRIQLFSRGIPEPVVRAKWNHGFIWSHPAEGIPVKRKVGFDKSRLVVTYAGRAVRRRPEGWKAD